MKLQYIGLIGVGLIAALCAMVLIAWTQNNAKPVSDTVDVVVATQDVKALTKITQDMCDIQKIAKHLAPKVFVPDPTSVIGQVVVVPLVKGQVYTQACFAPE